MTPNFRIMVVGVGGSGINAVNRMIKEGVTGIEFTVVDTDAQALLLSNASTRIRIGDETLRGLGTGGDPKLGRLSAEESSEKLLTALKGVDMVFIVAGIGGGTGSGASPVIARIARDVGAVTIAIVSRPFTFEGKHRVSVADVGINQLKSNVDTLIVIPNDRLLTIVNKDASLEDAFRFADDILRQFVQGITEVVTLPGLMGIDFNDIRSIMSKGGAALVTMGRASGEDRAFRAVDQAISSALLDITIDSATNVLLSITGGPNLSLAEVNQVAAIIREIMHPDGNMVFGVRIDPNLGDEIRLTLVAAFGAVSDSVPDLSTKSKGIEIQSEDILTPTLLKDAISPYLESIANLQYVINDLKGVSSLPVSINSLVVTFKGKSAPPAINVGEVKKSDVENRIKEETLHFLAEDANRQQVRRGDND